MSYTREQNIKIIEGYMPGRDMKDLSILIQEAIKNTFPEWEAFGHWQIDLPDRTIENLAELCAKESNDFYRKYA